MKVNEIIIAICVIVFIGQQVFGSYFESQFLLTPAYLMERPWTMLTSMFAHASITHLFFNMFALFIFGSVLEQRIGKGNYLALYLVSGVIGSIGFILLGGNPFGSALGASGAIYGVIGALALLRPNMVVYLMGIPMPMYVAGFVYTGIEILGLGAADGIAHSAHLLGLFGGIGIARVVKDSMDDFNLYAAVAVGVVLSIIVSIGFGYYYNSGFVSEIKNCEQDTVGYAISCLSELAQQESNEHNKNIICREYGQAFYYSAGDGYESAYLDCMK